MKLGKYILGLALIAVGLTSCDTENKGAIYEPTVANVSFMTTEQSTLTKSNNLTVPVAVSRATTNGVATYAITITDASAGVTLKEQSVSFEAGDGMAYVDVEFANMAPGQEYHCTLNLSPEATATANPDFGEQITSTVVSVMCDFDWEDLGNGFYSSPEWWGEEFYVPIIHAKGSNIYRMIGLFESGYDIEFTIESDNKVYVDSQPSWYHSSYGNVYLVGDANDTADGYAGTYDPASKKATFTMYHYVPNLGGFGTFTDTLTMP